MITNQGERVKTVLNENELQQLAEELYNNTPNRTCSWDVLHETLQAKWMVFAKFAYHTILIAAFEQSKQ